MKDKKFILLVDGIEVECEAASSFNIEIEEPKGFDGRYALAMIISPEDFMWLLLNKFKTNSKGHPIILGIPVFQHHIFDEGEGLLLTLDGSASELVFNADKEIGFGNSYSAKITKKQNGYDVEFKREK